MALKGDRIVVATDISFFSNAVAERGGIASISTAGSGVANDQSAAIVNYAATGSGSYPVGLMLNDMVNYDLTRQHINFHRDEVQLGGKVTLLRIGTVSTNLTSGTMTNCAGLTAYLGNYGRVCATNVGNSAQPVVGRFLSNPDENGFVKLAVSL